MLIEARRATREKQVDPLAVFIDPILFSIEELVETRDHIAAFEDGKLSLDELLRGPAGPYDESNDCDCPACSAEREFLEHFFDFAGEPREERPRPGSKARKKARKQQKKSRRKNRRKR